MSEKPLKLGMKAQDPIIGQQLGDYTIVSLLGRGGMARVYKGFDASLERYAAVKVIDAQLATGSDAPEYRERFHREARAIARLHHPNIVSVYQFGEHANLYYMAMMFIEGQDLTQVLREHAQRRTRMSYGAVLRVARDIAAALDHAHREGVIHRDIKPSNIMVMNDGHAILTDFGLALSVPEGSIGNTFGSAHYIAPEQAVASNNAVPQSDLYSLAVVIYQMLAGRVPFDDPSAMSVAIKHLQEPPPPPSVINPELTATVDGVLLKALHKLPEKRYPNGSVLVAALEKALQAAGKNLAYSGDGLPARVAEPNDGFLVDAGDGTPILAPEQHPTAILPPLYQNNAERASAPKRPDASNNPPTAPSRPEIKPLTQPRPAVTPVWAQDLAGDMGSLPRLPTSKPRRRPLVIVAVVGMLALVGLGLLMLSMASEPMSSVALEPTATQAEPSPTPDVPVVTPTLNATASAPTPIPAETGAGGASQPSADEEPQLLLRYDSGLMTLTNISDQLLDLSQVEFVQRQEDGSERVFRASQWSSGRFSMSRLEPGDCVQVWTDTFVNRDAPTDCTRQAWRAVSRPRWFWVSSQPEAQFLVRVGRDTLAVCAITAGECAVSLD